MEDLESLKCSLIKSPGDSSKGRYLHKKKGTDSIILHDVPYIFTCDENDKIKMIKNHSIVIKDGVIKEIIPSVNVELNKYNLVYEAGKKGGVVVTPGLINTHAHPPMYLMRSIMTLDEGEKLEETISSMPRWERLMDEKDYAVGAMGDISEQQRYGITTTLSHYGVFNPIDFAASATNHNVINALSAVSNTHPENSPEMIENLLKKGNYFSKPAIALHYLHKADDSTLNKVRRIIKNHDILFTFHMAESKSVEKECVKRYGIREVELLKKKGLLNENTITSHSIYLSDDEIKTLIKAKVGISHLPTSNVIHKSGVFQFWKFCDYGGFQKISLGTDGVVSKGRVDLLSEAYQTRVTHLYHRTVKFGSLFKMVTANGARVLGLKDRGKIIPGYRADLAIWKLNDISCIPYDYNDPITLISNLITRGGRPVRDLMIDGKFVIKNRKHQFVNESFLLKQLQKSHMAIRKRSTEFL